MRYSASDRSAKQDYTTKIVRSQALLSVAVNLILDARKELKEITGAIGLLAIKNLIEHEIDELEQTLLTKPKWLEGS